MSDDVEAARYLARRPVGDLFSQPPEQPAFSQRWASLTDAEREAQRERWKERLLPVVLDLADRCGPEGFIAADVQSEGITRGILNGEASFLSANRNAYSFLGGWLSVLAEQGVIGRYMLPLANGGALQLERKSERDASHGNKGKVYVSARMAA
jgi:hypothetical protein